MKQIALTAAFMASSLPGMANTFMGIDNMEDATGIIAIIMVFGLPAFIVFMMLWFGHKNKKAKYKVISEALASGKELPKELFQDKSSATQSKEVLSKGIKNIFLGIGLTIMLWCLTEEPGVASIGVLVFFIGVGKVVVAYATRDEKETEEKKNNTHSCTDIEKL